MSLDTYVPSKVGHSLYEVRRYKASALLESTTVDLTKAARSDFEIKRLTVAKRYASEGCPKGSAYWFGQDGSLNKTKLVSESQKGLDEAISKKHFQDIADVLAAHKGNMTDEAHRGLVHHMSSVLRSHNPRFDHNRFVRASGSSPGPNSPYGSKD